MANLKSNLPSLLILAGILSILSVVALTQYPNFLSRVQEKPIFLHSKLEQISLPKAVEFEGLNKNIGVIPGEYKNGEWTLSEASALYLKGSGVPGKKGNVVLYGHNTHKVFGDLQKVKRNSAISLTLENGTTLRYKVDQIKTVTPLSVEILEQPNNIEKITLYTCNGFLDSTRLVVVGTKVI